MRNFARFFITPKGERAARNGHPWVFGEEVTKVEGSYTNGDLVDVVTNKGKYLGTGFVNDTWWNHHAVSGNGKLQQLCPICKEPFFAYPSSHRKYCSRLCYGKYRKEMAHGKRTLP